MRLATLGRKCNSYKCGYVCGTFPSSAVRNWTVHLHLAQVDDLVEIKTPYAAMGLRGRFPC